MSTTSSIYDRETVVLTSPNHRSTAMGDTSSPDIHDQKTILATSSELDSDSDVEIVENDIPLSVVRFIDPIYDSPESPDENGDSPKTLDPVAIEYKNYVEENSDGANDQRADTSSDYSPNSNDAPLLKPSLTPLRSVTIEEYEKLAKPESPPGKSLVLGGTTTITKKRGRPRKNKYTQDEHARPTKKGRPNMKSTEGPSQLAHSETLYPIRNEFYDDPEIANLKRMVQQIEELGHMYKLRVFEGIGKIVYYGVARVTAKIEARKLVLKAKGVQPTPQGCQRCGVSDENNSLRSGLRCRICL
ncbi:hypothetical protein QAD02_013424 [Eretmocerus hayati]|uniref:Uncharacterized protein n=1 Tax=Eretmocerus hayati TaxID=131215 RepID=A0ACC2P5D1_9HYME|nr:hypothetical protein QAD02_013424 [Eretmocerus hayati]